MVNPFNKCQELGPYRCDGLENSDLTDSSVLEAMSNVPRHLFVPVEEIDVAYTDQALPIDCGQTISQPYIVALMTQEARVKPGSKVLEVGTGSGYQACILSELGAEVFSVEIIPQLSAEAERMAERLGFSNIHFRVGDGWLGWQEKGPFDAILVTALCPGTPILLLEQLKEGGNLLAPVEEPGRGDEVLWRYEKTPKGILQHRLCAVRFVPLVGLARAPH